MMYNAIIERNEQLTIPNLFFRDFISITVVVDRVLVMPYFVMNERIEP